MADNVFSFPAQQLPHSKKTDKWRKQCVDWGAERSFSNYSLVRKSVKHKKINYDLIDGILHIEDVEKLIHYDKKNYGYIPENIQHYPIIAPKLRLLAGEEAKRTFDCKVIVTNPNAVTDIERKKRDEIRKAYEQFLQGPQQEDMKDEAQLRDMQRYYMYEWQDYREQRANELLNHYIKELNIPLIFNKGFYDALIVGEEMYQCDIVSGEPVIRKLNPLKTHLFRSGFSDRVEDADIVVIEDYWSPGIIFDHFYDALSEKDRKYLEEINTREMDGDNNGFDRDPTARFYNVDFIGEDGVAVRGFDPMSLASSSTYDHLAPYDMAGNIRVIQVYWKSRKKILKVKSYDEVTGDEVINFYPEGHKIDETKGEEAEDFWVNEAWEGTKIGDKVYVNIRPRPIQYCRISNPSICHFGIIGSIYNLNEGRPYSAVDMMKPFNYLYDVVHDRLNRLMARNWGKLIDLDLAKIPAGWDVEKWLYFAREEGLSIKNSFNEGNIGAATGKLAGALNNASTGVIDLDTGNAIQAHISTLQFLKQEMSDIFGVSPQREGAISNRETVGGVERATVQSAHITEWLFFVHTDVKKRVYECFLETAKEAMRGRNIKFQYICSDCSERTVEFNGDEFAENDYGLVVDSSDTAEQWKTQIETLAQAALQNQALDFSTIMKLYNSASLSEKQSMVEQSENEMRQRQQQEQQMQQQILQQQAQTAMQQAQMQQQFQKQINDDNNATRVKVAQIEAQSKFATVQDPKQFQAELNEKKREFDEQQKLDEKKLKAQLEDSQRERDNNEKISSMELSQKNKASRREESGNLAVNQMNNLFKLFIEEIKSGKAERGGRK